MFHDTMRDFKRQDFGLKTADFLQKFYKTGKKSLTGLLFVTLKGDLQVKKQL